MGWRGRGIEGGPVGLPQHEGLVLEGGREREGEGRGETSSWERREGGRERHHHLIATDIT